MTTAHMRIHLTNGEHVEGIPQPCTREDLDRLRDSLRATVCQDHWQANIETPTGWVIVPSQSIRLIEIVSDPPSASHGTPDTP